MYDLRLLLSDRKSKYFKMIVYMIFKQTHRLSSRKSSSLLNQPTLVETNTFPSESVQQIPSTTWSHGMCILATTIRGNHSDVLAAAAARSRRDETLL